MVVMRTVVLGPRPPELERLIQRRRELGIDTYDEVWEGSYHVAPAASAAHAYLDNTLAVLLHPYAKAAGLIGTGPFNLVAQRTIGCRTGATTGRSRGVRGCLRPP